MTVSIDVFHEALPNGGAFKNVLEGHSKDYPMYQHGICTPKQWMCVAEVALNGNTIIATDDKGNQGFCVYCTGSDPHVDGEVLFMEMTVSCSTACTKAIVKHLKEEAYRLGCQYLWMSKRTGEYSYTGTFHKLVRNTNG